MLFAHDTASALQTAAALVNTAPEAGEPGKRDTLTTVAELDAFYGEFGFTGRHARDRAELEEVRRLRPVLRELLTSERDAMVPIVNRLLADAGAVPRLVRHDDWDWHLHAIDSEESLASRIAVETAMGMVDVIRADETSRLGVCADEDCDGIVVDLSRNRSRRFCSTTCGNRAAQAAYRARSR